jgi:hypothetical protein
MWDRSSGAVDTMRARFTLATIEESLASSSFQQRIRRGLRM